MTPTRRSSLAAVVALLALVVALLSSPLPGQAASLIKGKQIARNAITTPKIKNNAVTTPKIRNKAVTSRKLAGGAVGSREVRDGSLGATDLAAGVLPTAYWRETAGNNPLPTTFADIVGVQVPAGSYAVTGSVSLTNITGSAQDGRCRIFDGTNGRGAMRPFDISAQKSNDSTVSAVVVLAAPGTLSLQCRTASGALTIYTASQASPQVMAIRVGRVEDQTP